MVETQKRRKRTRRQGDEGHLPLLRRVAKPSRAVAAVLAGAILGWAVTYFAPGIFSWVKGVSGQSPIRVRVDNPQVGYLRNAAYLPPGFVIPRPINELDAPPESYRLEDRYKWAYTRGGVDANTTEYDIVVQGRSASPVIIEGVRVNVLSRRPPVQGVHIRDQGGDLVDVRALSIDLDKDPPELSLQDGYEGKKWNFPLQVSETEIEYIHVFAGTEKYDVEWTVSLDYSANDKRYSMIIDNGGKPFRTTSAKGLRTYYPEGKTFKPWPGGTT
jgi:hypothetical protein